MEAELRIITRRRRRVTALDAEIARGLLSVPSDAAQTQQALSLISKRDLFQLVESSLRPKPTVGFSASLIVTGPLSWRLVGGRTSEKSEFPIATSRAEFPLAVEELLSVVKATFSGRAKNVRKLSLLGDLRQAAYVGGLIGNSVVRFALRKFRAFYRFGRFSMLFSLVQLLGAAVGNPKVELSGNTPEIVAGLVGLLTAPNLLQSGTGEKRKFLRRAVARLLNQTLRRLGSPHGETLTMQLAQELLPVVDKIPDCQLAYFLEIAGLHLACFCCVWKFVWKYISEE